MAEHTKLPWAYRPQEYDDWGWIRGPDGTLAATAKGHSGPGAFDDRRRAGTDPYAANAALIVKAVNAHDALVKHLQHLAAVCCDEDALRLLDSLTEPETTGDGK